MPLVIGLEKPKGGAMDDEDPASGEMEAEGETTAAQRTAGKAFAQAVKGGDGEAVWLAFAELCALHSESEDDEY